MVKDTISLLWRTDKNTFKFMEMLLNLRFTSYNTFCTETQTPDCIKHPDTNCE